ncbi:E3 SUMO-protein ligase NSE2-like [Discoglossus pictus]
MYTLRGDAFSGFWPPDRPHETVTVILPLEANHLHTGKPWRPKEKKSTVGISQATASEEGFVDVDEDIAVSQSQMNFMCPITQLEMTNPVKNKVCGHTYEREAIERMIQNRHQKKKKARCPKVGCDHSDMKITDLIPDTALKRAMEIQNKQKSRH